MPDVTPSQTMVRSAALQRRGFTVVAPTMIVSPGGAVFPSPDAAWAYVHEVEEDAHRRHEAWRAGQAASRKSE